MEVGYAYLMLDKDWDMEELSQLSRLYTQCYSLVYSLSGFKVESDDKKVIDWFQGTYSKYPWKGGYSALNFYNSLYAKIPGEQRPQIKEIQYASPGHIKLKEAVVTATILATIVTAVSTSINQVNDTYNQIHKGMSARKITKIEVEKAELELGKERLDYIKQCNKLLIESMDVPMIMQDELIRRCDDNDLMKLKILMSFYRRVQPIAEMQALKKLKVEVVKNE